MIMRLFLMLILLSASLLVSASEAVDQLQAAHPDYVGSENCAGCHPKQYQQWLGSDHRWSMQPANSASVKGDFADRSFDYFGQSSRFFRRGEQFWVETQDDNGKQRAYQISYTFGVYPLQQYLVGFEDGRYQVLNIAWDARPEAEGGQRWFHLHPEQPLLYDSPLHWTGPYQRWNSRCAHCHSTNLRKNFEPASQHYNSRYSEVSVGCEACHGAGNGHLQWADKTPGEAGAKASAKQIIKESDSTKGLTDNSQLGLSRWLQGRSRWQRDAGQSTAVNIGGSNKQQLQACAGCHSRRVLLAEGGASHRSFAEGHQLRLLQSPLYHADGQIKDEVFVYGSFLQSKMHQRGVECSNCHDPHSLKLKAEGNQLCTQCHAADTFDQPSHHHHPVASEGAQCVNCHMPATTYMQVDPRRDHSLRIPRPERSVGSELPNACNGCHQDRTPRWAADALDSWLSEQGKTLPEDHSAALLKLPQASQQTLVELINQPLPGIIKATALTQLGATPDASSLKLLEAQLADSDPLIRRAALQAMQVFPLRYKAASAIEALWDEDKAVRLQAFQLVAEMNASQLPVASRSQFQQAEQEFRDWLALHADTPDGQLRLGNFYSARRRVELAEAHYRQALAYNPEFVPALLNLAELYRRQQRDGDARPLLMWGLALAPGEAALHHALGLLSVRQKNYPLAVRQLQQAWQLQPENRRYGYVAAVAMEAAGDLPGAIALLKRINQRFPADRQVAAALRSFQQKAARQ